ncbi:hypothetical protein IV203_029106 [Nitzschia inconspicua]|uniref:Uncharacterized protein n=1 Tax=Nitzschia inconspicua TaxID=303405 RepID=A0A9K3LTQ5_9STRA|nr:hypothetical protein IV203_029106 [Nitzschia inconspicua]
MLTSRLATAYDPFYVVLACHPNLALRLGPVSMHKECHTIRRPNHPPIEATTQKRKDFAAICTFGCHVWVRPATKRPDGFFNCAYVQAISHSPQQYHCKRFLDNEGGQQQNPRRYITPINHHPVFTITQSLLLKIPTPCLPVTVQIVISTLPSHLNVPQRLHSSVNLSLNISSTILNPPMMTIPLSSTSKTSAKLRPFATPAFTSPSKYSPLNTSTCILMSSLPMPSLQKNMILATSLIAN